MSNTRDGSGTHSQTKDPPVTSQFAEIREQLAQINQRLSELGDLKTLVNSLKEQNEAKDRKIATYSNVLKILNNTQGRMT